VITYVVVLAASHVYGPFADRDEARAFAEFLGREVDPAAVVPLHSPTAELLAWRSGVALPAMTERTPK
jgi:hypothetical protein